MGDDTKRFEKNQPVQLRLNRLIPTLAATDQFYGYQTVSFALSTHSW
jgi:hypothetical protein